MAALEISIIGAGRLGKTLGRLLVANDCGNVVGVCNRSIESAEEAVLFIGQGDVCADIKDLPPADLILLTCDDVAIEPCTQELSQAGRLRESAIAVHCSGSLSSEVLHPLRSNGCSVASVHPMSSFAEPGVSVTQFSGTYCAIEGDAPATLFLRSLFENLGAKTFEVDPKQKALYHAGGVFASNYVVTLFDKAIECLEKSGIKREVATQIVLGLMGSTLHNLNHTLSSNVALTGPIKRGDVTTVSNHINAMPNKELALLYQALGRATLDLAKLPPSEDAAMNKALRLVSCSGDSSLLPKE